MKVGWYLQCSHHLGVSLFLTVFFCARGKMLVFFCQDVSFFSNCHTGLLGSDNLAFVNDDGEEELHKGGGDEMSQQEGSREDNLIRLSSLFGEQPHRPSCPLVTEMMTKNVCDCHSQQICHESQQKEEDWDVESNVSDAGMSI